MHFELEHERDRDESTSAAAFRTGVRMSLISERSHCYVRSLSGATLARVRSLPCGLHRASCPRTDTIA
jgi:hypothetical protein